MARPRKPSVRVPIRIRQDHHDVLRRFAEIQGLPISEVVGTFIAPAIPAMSEIVNLMAMVQAGGQLHPSAIEGLATLKTELEGILSGVSGQLQDFGKGAGPQLPLAAPEPSPERAAARPSIPRRGAAERSAPSALTPASNTGVTSPSVGAKLAPKARSGRRSA